VTKKETAFGTGPGYRFYKAEGTRVASQDDTDTLEGYIHNLSSESHLDQQRAAAVCHSASDENPGIFSPYVGDLLEALTSRAHPSVIRCTLRIFSVIEIPEKHIGDIVDRSFKYLSDRSQTVAVQVYAMTIIANHLNSYPDLAPELEAILKTGWEHGTPGYRNRASKIAAKHGWTL